MEVIIGEVGGIHALKEGPNWVDLVHSHVHLESQKTDFGGEYDIGAILSLLTYLF